MTRQIPFASLLLITLMPLSPATLASNRKAMPATMEEMWKIIQQQQQQIEELKSRITRSEAADDKSQPDTASPPVSKAAAAATESPQGAKPDAASASTGATSATKARSGTARTEAERKTDILASEVEKLKTRLLIPDKREYKTEYGLGPAASEIYRVNRGLSIGGYGEWFYTHRNQGAKSTFDDARAVLYVGYKFNDWILMNSEFEFEHATTGEGAEEKGEVSNEFAYLDFLLNPKANIRTGLMLVPMGFINEIHEGPTFHGNHRPNVEQFIIPTTWRELGAGVWGELAEGLQYRMYAMNGLNAEGFGSDGIREGKQSGSYAVANDFAFTGRVDYSMPFAPGLQAGASAWVGDSGQGNVYSSREFGAQKVNAMTQLYEGHLQWHWRGLEMRALGAVGTIGNAAQLSAARGQTIGSQNYGWYTELAYDVMPWLWPESTHYLAPFFRYESYNTLARVPNGFTNYGGLYDQWIYQAGLTYKPIVNVAIKLDYRNINSAGSPLPDEVNLGVAFMY